MKVAILRWTRKLGLRAPEPVIPRSLRRCPDEDGAAGDSQEGILSSFVHVARLLNGSDADHVPIAVLVSHLDEALRTRSILMAPLALSYVGPDRPSSDSTLGRRFRLGRGPSGRGGGATKFAGVSCVKSGNAGSCGAL